MRKTKIKRIPFSTNKLFPILILVATIFMGVGYASINSIILNINGEVVAKAQDGIYITEIEYVSDVNANLIESKILSAYQTLLNSNIILSDVDPNSSITYKIAIYNSSDKNYIFDGVSYDKEFYSNNNITYSSTGLDIGYELYSKNTVVFDITFKYIDDILLSESITQLESYLKFNFVEAVETPLIYEDASIKKLTPLDTGYITFDEKEIVQGTIVRCNQNAVPIYDSYLVSANNVTVPTTCQVFDTLKESIEKILIMLKIHHSVYYYHCNHKENSYHKANQELDIKIKEIYEQSKGRYGSPKITKELNNQGIEVSQKRVARRMKLLGLSSIVVRKYNHSGNNNVDNNKEYPNILEQDFLLKNQVLYGLEISLTFIL